MRKYLIASILITGLYSVFFVSLMKNKGDVYIYNKEIHLNDNSISKELQDQINIIKNNPNWLEQTKRQAKIRGLTICTQRRA